MFLIFLQFLVVQKTFGSLHHILRQTSTNIRLDTVSCPAVHHNLEVFKARPGQLGEQFVTFRLISNSLPTCPSSNYKSNVILNRKANIRCYSESFGT